MKLNFMALAQAEKQWKNTEVINSNKGRILIMGMTETGGCNLVVRPEVGDIEAYTPTRLATPAGIHGRICIEITLYQHIVVSDLERLLDRRTYPYEDGYHCVELTPEFAVFYKPRKGIKLIDLDELEKRYLAQNFRSPELDIPTPNLFSLMSAIPVMRNGVLSDLVSLHQKSSKPRYVQLKSLHSDIIVLDKAIGKDISDVKMIRIGNVFAGVSKVYTEARGENRREIDCSGYMLSLHSFKLKMTDKYWLRTEIVKTQRVDLTAVQFKLQKSIILGVMTARGVFTFMAIINSKFRLLYRTTIPLAKIDKDSTLTVCSTSKKILYLVIGQKASIMMLQINLN